MNLTKWDPFRELEEVSNRLNQLFHRTPSRTEPDGGMLAMADWSPTVDITETDSAYVIKGEIPGVSKNDVKVSIENGMISLRGERKQEKEEKNKKFHRIERSYGSFFRSFQLPDDVDETKVKAEFKDGMINVILPKSAKSKAKSINVSIT